MENNSYGENYIENEIIKEDAERVEPIKVEGLTTLKSSIVSILLVAINIVVFVVLEIGGNTKDGSYMLERGAMFPAYMLYDKQWYRLITAMFMHFGIEHLLNNMLLLFFLGRIVEKAMGTVRYVALYFFSGFMAGFISFFWMLLNGENNIVCGASGAIFGLVGALLVIVLVHKGRYEGITLPRMILMAVLVLYFGFATAHTDNAGHVGGLVFGFLIAFCIYGIPYLFKRHRNRVKILSVE